MVLLQASSEVVTIQIIRCPLHFSLTPFLVTEIFHHKDPGRKSMDAEKSRVSVCHDDTNLFSWLKVYNLAETLDAVEEFSLGKNLRYRFDIFDFVAVAKTSDDAAKSIRVAAV